ncbi:CTB family bacteriocin [Calothrix rhizosoleniae]|uniref:CTB family bacteriocin n=1 Tax=Calothrix rhizosoleniae TaxID=888997 RepID=UPI000B49A6F5|nr:CTB family bacteriocin [Calothrix rhizosoleniae]
MLSNKSELFVEIPEEQQEIVSGGDLFGLNGSSYEELGFFLTATSAGEDGASTLSIVEIIKKADALVVIEAT